MLIKKNSMSVPVKTKEDYENFARRPTYEGIAHLEFDPDYPIINLIDKELYEKKGRIQLRRQKNIARASEPSPDSVAKWEKLHTTGKYDDFLYEAPTIDVNAVTGDEINTGYTKTKGKIAYFLTKNNGEIKETDTIGVWKVKYKDFEEMSANYWRKQSQICENIEITEREDFIQDPRTNDDIAGTLISLLEDKEFEIVNEEGFQDETGLDKAIAHSKVTKTTQAKEVKKIFYESLGMVNSVAGFSGGVKTVVKNHEGATTTIGDEEQKALEEFVKKHPDISKENVILHNVQGIGEGGLAYALIEKVLMVISNHKSSVYKTNPLEIFVIFRILGLDSYPKIVQTRPSWSDWFTNPKKLFMKVKDSWKSVLDTDNDIENVTINVRFQYQNPTEQTNFWSEESETQYEFIK